MNNSSFFSKTEKCVDVRVLVNLHIGPLPRAGRGCRPGPPPAPRRPSAPEFEGLFDLDGQGISFKYSETCRVHDVDDQNRVQI